MPMTSKDEARSDEYDVEDGDSLPTYEYLAERNPNSRFGRWKEWVEKRAAERYADIDEAEMQRRRGRGWGDDIIDNDGQSVSASQTFDSLPIPDPSRLSISTPPAPAPPIYSELAQPHIPPGTTTGTAIDPAHISMYNFGSRFLPHSKSPIHALLPIMQDRFLLIGTKEGMSMIDTTPSNIDENSNLVEGLSAAIQRDLWKGESIYQLSLLEYNNTPSGVPRGVVMALVGTDLCDCPDFRSVRMYNLSSLASLAIWTASQRNNQPVDLQPLSRANSPSTLKKHRPRSSMSRSIKSLIAEPSSPPTDSPSMNLEPKQLRPPQKNASIDLAQSQWDVVEDLPQRWASDYVSLATESSKLGGMSVICYEIWREGEGGRLSQTKLAIATKNHIFLYATPKGERSFKFIKEYYTPFPPRQLRFVYQNPDKTNVGPQNFGHSRELSASISLNFTEQLCLFVRYDKKAGLIRLGDSAVSEVELAEDSSTHLQEPSINPPRSSPVRKSLSLSESICSVTKEKSRWLLPSHIDVPGTGSTTAGSLYFLTKGLSTHILPSPLPNPINSKWPFMTISWMDAPSAVLPRIINNNPDQPPMLQLLALGPEGVEVQEISFSFLTKGKGKGTVETPVRAFLDTGPVGFLSTGSAWHRGTQQRQRLASLSSFIIRQAGEQIHEEGIYGWVMKGYQDWRIIWFGGSGELQ